MKFLERRFLKTRRRAFAHDAAPFEPARRRAGIHATVGIPVPAQRVEASNQQPLNIPIE